ncbi:hypothetical protein GCM10022224_103880 [Nonomuraea antimicrobica]|uniref:Uncharacterized protein n=1 Tax=Nonomuraea antimicrobica TaxID=561173 RepID=A0ABP7EQS9_9ACTN
MDRMTAALTLACDVLPVADGALIVPHVLPIHAPESVYGMTVQERLGIPPA